MLVKADYRGVERLSNGIRLSAGEIAGEIEEYGRELIEPPDRAFEEIDVIRIRDTSPAEYSVRFRLFTMEEGESDLEIQLTLIDDSVSQTCMRFEMDGILVP